ncbi:MAG: inositol monophosphatase [Hamadaea sp.]|nr:inositol monophosphatase [Hamadaea sp.]NUR50551.1 inositol monophosphatase [Hamadaea sp.]NUT06251.1 inositol monophosphatase [Hamadaea sp.]
MPFAAETRFAVAIARRAGLAARESTGHGLVETKSSFADLRTATDLRVERLVRDAIRAAFPRHAVVGEETAADRRPPLDGPTWFVDPVDGTTNFVHGIPHVACNVALWADGALRCGATVDVTRRSVYWSAAGRGTRQGRRLLRVSDVAALAGSVIATGFPYDRAVRADNNLPEFARIVPRVQDVRRLGCAGLDLAWVAAGRLDGYWEQGNGPWDWAAGALLVREAGGTVTTYDGTPWRPGDETLVASNGRIHDELLGLIQSTRAAVFG